VVGLLFDAQAVALRVEFGYAIALRVVHVIAEYGGLVFVLGGMNALRQQLGEPGTIEDIVAENETGTVIADKFLADDECLCQTVGTGLLGVFKSYAEVAAVA